MQAMAMDLHANTPTVTVFDNRSQAVREVAFHRHPGTPTVTDTRITRHHYDPRGFLNRSQDPRLFAADLANFTWLADLAGTAVRTQGVDPGISLDLNDIAGRPLLAVSQIAPGPDGDDHRQAVTRTWRHEPPTLPGRLLAITEHTSGEPVRQAERFVYAGTDQAARQRNLAGRCSHHYDTAGLLRTDSLALTGPALASLRRLLKVADDVGLMSDWQGDDASVWETQLVPEGEGHLTVSTLDATGTRLSSIDAAGHGQRVAYDVAGHLRGSWLKVTGTAEQAIVVSLDYAATEEKREEVHSNGVVTHYTREPRTQRLAGIRTERPGAKVLQDLRYTYDPVGNVQGRVDEALAITYWRNQKVEPRNTYEYDSLYQLVSARGREMAGGGKPGPVRLPFHSFDYATYTNYTRLYSYDTAGNLTRIEHQADAGGNSHTTDITVSDRSNRAVTGELASSAADVEALFTAGGQQKQLFPGQHLAWTLRAELLQVKPVTREGEPDDHEGYRYAGDNQRLLKVSAQKTSGGERTQRVVYLPGLELRHTATAGSAVEDLQVICVGQAGRAQVRVLHWVTGKPPEIDNDQLRFSYDDLLGSGALELDGQGEVISQEEYFPFGGTAVFSARSEAEGSYKVLRYSGKERDATGLYYYGYRYYQPWVGRWLSADPGGTLDGLNIFAMLGNNPITFLDSGGLIKTEANEAGHEAEVLPQSPGARPVLSVVKNQSPPSKENPGAAQVVKARSAASANKVSLKLVERQENFDKSRAKEIEMKAVNDAARSVSAEMRAKQALESRNQRWGPDQDKLLEEAAAQHKVQRDQVVDIRKTRAGKVVWLETGNEKSGLQHIHMGHEDNFIKQDIPADEIHIYIMDALESGEVIGLKGTRGVYKLKGHYMSIGVGDNGYVVQANPLSEKDAKKSARKLNAAMGKA
ncbi:RHS repeat protein [Pseudomonas entomophila]|uniref:Insecticidal toxin SepC/TccC n=2 Tax=Pseudomonas entomophila TaxID=312306 RepID=Q1IAM6_PSEE4|nr:RHS repeat domain-containing protein [Pseudomonas entomophila]WMW03939.1 RHS repeat domain-containing protein [Pseudomonas entomophila]CAK15290.1 insecticidal toxin SepC/TccC [Pseudomonas entomophila L48]